MPAVVAQYIEDKWGRVIFQFIFTRLLIHSLLDYLFFEYFTILFLKLGFNLPILKTD